MIEVCLFGLVLVMLLAMAQRMTTTRCSLCMARLDPCPFCRGWICPRCLEHR